MELRKSDVMTWAPANVLEAGSQLQAKGVVVGLQTGGEILAGSIKMGASRMVVRIVVRGGKAVKVQCHCNEARGGKVCQHAVAVGLRWCKTHGGEDAEEMVFAGERVPTLKEIERWAGTALLSRAERLERSGAVSRVQFAYPMGSGEVRVGGASFVPTFTVLPSGLVQGTCQCGTNRDERRLCEHIFAVALAVMHRFGGEERRAAYAAERARAARLAGAQGMIQRSPHGTPAMLRVFLPREVEAQFARGSIQVGVLVFLGASGVNPRHLPEGSYAFSDGDETLLGMLEDIAGGPIDERMTLKREDFLALLRCGMRSWVGSAATRKRLTFGEPLETPLVVEADPEADALRVGLRLPERGAILAAGKLGFWLGEGTARPLARVLPEVLHAIYKDKEVIPRSRMMAFFKQELPQLAQLLPVAPESVTADLFTTSPAVPRFRLELRGSEASVAGKLFAGYGNTWVAAGGHGEVSLGDPDDFYHCLVRNPDAEREALERTHAMGFMGARGDDLGTLNGIHRVRNLLGAEVTAARRAGWRVDVLGPLGDFWDAAEVIVPVVSVREAEGGFEVATTYEAPRGGFTVTAAEVDLALAKGNAYVECGGGVALLDIGAIRRIRDTLVSCRARTGSKSGAARVEAVHAAFVQAALENLEGIDFESSPDWRERAGRQNRTRRPEPVDLGRLEGTLRPYQKEGVYWLRFLEECGFCGILADEMGLGKTLQTLTWLQLPRCREEARRVPALIICPTSLVENWRREAEKFVPWMRVLVLSGPDRAAHFAEVPRADLVITSYALIRRDVAFHAACPYSAIVLDEAQAIKNRTTQNALAVKQIRSDTRLVLSGTPIENGVADLWSIMDFLMPKYLGPYDDFQVAYEDPIANGGRAAEAAQVRLRDKLHPFLLRRVKKDVAKDLPDKIRSVTYCALTPDQRKEYDAIRGEVREKMRGLVREKGFEKAKFEVLALLMRLRQICCDLRLLKERQAVPGEAPSAKLDALMELLSEARAGGHRMLVFSQFTSMLALIAERLREEGLPHCYLDGSTKDRLGECARFNQNPEIPVFLISLKAGGTGLNLTGADMVVHFDPWWNPAAEEQATDRAHRIGQKKTVQAIKLIAQDTIEEKVLELQRKKQALIEATVNASDASIVSTLTISEIESLLA